MAMKMADDSTSMIPYLPAEMAGISRADFLSKFVGPAGAVLYLPGRRSRDAWRLCADRKALRGYRERGQS